MSGAGAGHAMLAGKCALVTGSVGGLGFAIADRLAAAGANVILNGLCAPGEGEAAAAQIAEAHGVRTCFDPADLTDLAAIEAMVQGANDRFGGVDILVNNAVVRHFGPLEDLAPENWDRSIAVNLTAPFHLVRLTLGGMKAKGWGRIINMTSAFSQRGSVGRIDYVTTKTALLGLTRNVALEAAGAGVTCNGLSPGSVPTPAILGKLEGMAAAENRTLDDIAAEYLAERHPTGRFVAMNSVAAAAVFLCSPAGDDITGAVLPIDGGWTAR